MGKPVILSMKQDSEYWYFEVLVDDEAGMITPEPLPPPEPYPNPDWVLCSRYGKNPPMLNAEEGKEAPKERMSEKEYQVLILAELREEARAMAAHLVGPAEHAEPWSL